MYPYPDTCSAMLIAPISIQAVTCSDYSHVIVSGERRFGCVFVEEDAEQIKLAVNSHQQLLMGCQAAIDALYATKYAERNHGLLEFLLHVTKDIE